MENVVAIEVEKVQKYIFQKIDQSQKDDKTLRDVILASNDISGDILKKIEEKFVTDNSLEIKEEDKILWISGKVIFYVHLAESEIQKKLKDLYQQIYRDHQGNIFLNFITFERENLTKIEIVQRVNQELKNSKNKTKIIAENQELLFQFQEIEQKEQEYSRRDKYLDVFLSNMDDLVILDDRHKSESTDGKIAIVKADINNLGNIMKKIKEHPNFQKLSELLKNSISISQFAEYIREFNKTEILSQKEKLKILPFYIAGDDIFYAVRISDLFNSIKFLHGRIKDINSQIQKLQIKDCKTELTLAVGVVFVNNHQPIRYYRQTVEEELKQAKKVMKSDKALYSLVGISMAGNLLHIYKDELGKGENEGFIRFYTELEELRQMMRNKVFSRTALHNLLINLETEKDCDKQMLYVLYFCKPNLLSWNKIEDDIYVKYYWLSHLIEDKRQQEEKKERFFVPEKIRNILIPKLKLILLLLKDEYCIQLEDKKDKYIISTNQDDQKRRIRSVLFHKPINYILDRILHINSIDGIENLFFAKKHPDGRKQLYSAARFESSIFFRAKKLMKAGKKEQVLNMFKNYNQTFNQKREENESIHVLTFDERNFEQKFQNIVNGDTDWLDRLILLYQYNQQRIILKTTEKEIKNFRRNSMFEIKVKIITKSNCLIGNQTESFSVGGVDQATTVDEKARPIIQGSAFKGALRNIVREYGDEMPNTKNYVTVILQRLLEKYQSISKIEENKKIKKIMESIKNYCEFPKAEYIFGMEGLNNMPRLFCSDFRVVNEINSKEYFTIETKNSLEEKEGKIISRPRTYRVVKPGVVFEGILRFQDCYFMQEKENLDEIKKELIQAIKFFNSGFYGIGNSKSRGYGMIEVEIL